MSKFLLQLMVESDDAESTAISLGLGKLGPDEKIEDAVSNKIDKSGKDEEINCVTFGLETNEGKIVKVYVAEEDADGFEEAMARLLGKVDSIEEAINQLDADFNIIDVEWPEDDDGEENTDPNSDNDELNSDALDTVNSEQDAEIAKRAAYDKDQEEFSVKREGYKSLLVGLLAEGKGGNKRALKFLSKLFGMSESELLKYGTIDLKHTVSKVALSITDDKYASAVDQFISAATLKEERFVEEDLVEKALGNEVKESGDLAKQVWAIAKKLGFSSKGIEKEAQEDFIKAIKIHVKRANGRDSYKKAVKDLYSTVVKGEEKEQINEDAQLTLSSMLTGFLNKFDTKGAAGAILSSSQFSQYIQANQTSFTQILNSDSQLNSKLNSLFTDGGPVLEAKADGVDIAPSDDAPTDAPAEKKTKDDTDTDAEKPAETVDDTEDKPKKKTKAPPKKEEPKDKDEPAEDEPALFWNVEINDDGTSLYLSNEKFNNNEKLVIAGDQLEQLKAAIKERPKSFTVVANGGKRVKFARSEEGFNVRRLGNPDEVAIRQETLEEILE